MTLTKMTRLAHALPLEHLVRVLLLALLLGQLLTGLVRAVTA